MNNTTNPVKKSRVKNEGLKKQEQERKELTQKKIIDAIERLKTKNAKINFSSIANEASVSRNTVYTYKELIENNTSVKVSKSNEVKELESKLAEERKKNKVLLQKNREASQANQKMFEQIEALRLYIEDLEKDR